MLLSWRQMYAQPTICLSTLVRSLIPTDCNKDQYSNISAFALRAHMSVQIRKGDWEQQRADRVPAWHQQVGWGTWLVESRPGELFVGSWLLFQHLKGMSLPTGEEGLEIIIPPQTQWWGTAFTLFSPENSCTKEGKHCKVGWLAVFFQ